MKSLEFDLGFRLNDTFLIAGGDEVGRGTLAGPVVVAIVIMNLKKIPNEEIRDSKKLSSKKRKELEHWIKKEAICYAIEEVDNHEIDRINILQATKKAFTTCVKRLSIRPDILLLDAINLPDVDVKQEAIIKGDMLSYTIGCASILAKVYRDEKMLEYHQLYPGYAFDEHKGYGTSLHMERIEKLGASPIHRLSFKPFKKE